MGKRTRRYEIQFTACLLACGPMPWLNYKGDGPWFSDGVGRSRKDYQSEVMQWWIDWHAGTDTPTSKSQFRFYKKFRTWQKVYLRRTQYDHSN